MVTVVEMRIIATVIPPVTIMTIVATMQWDCAAVSRHFWDLDLFL